MKLSASGYYGVVICRICNHQAPPTTWHVEYSPAVIEEALALWNSHENTKPKPQVFRVMSPEQAESAAKAYYQQKMAEARSEARRRAPPPKPAPWWRKIIKKLTT